jgi:hypothetical protein
MGQHSGRLPVDLGVRAFAGAAIVLGLSLSGAPAHAQFFSPGPLARPHAALEGLENCAKCHEEQKGLSARLCLDCHKEVAGRVARGSGFHGHLAEPKRSDCASCHPDHRGRDFSMIDWEPAREKFDHRKTGWPLQGAHAKTKCDDCHQRRLVADAGIRQLLDKQPRRETLLGLSTRCDSCHFDEHRGQLGRDCAKCHKETEWKPTTTFGHQATVFPLRGKHGQVACARCHPSVPDERTPADAFPKPRAAAFLQMKPIEHGTCESCHEDPHKGSFGAACASCHSEVGWKIIQVGGTKNASFHDKTRFPLRGGHVGVTCRNCHGPFPGRPARFKGLAFERCSDCHEDAHLGQLRPKSTAKPPDCAACHTVNGFSPPRFETEQHAATKFPLEGAHAAASCRGCHVIDQKLQARVTPALHKKLKGERRPERWSFAVMRPPRSPQACAGCHEDVHHGQFADGHDKDTCSRCHRTSSFTDLTFDHAVDSRYPLTGKHAQAPCAGCHRTERQRAGQTMVRYKPLETACARCHADVHRGQFAWTLTSEGREQRRGCEDCHQTSAFQTTLFKHDDRRFTTFALEGEHATVACAACHRPVQLGAGVTAVRYRPLPRDCESCHVDFHKGEFRGFEP